jgi:hypothetical protein
MIGFFCMFSEGAEGQVIDLSGQWKFQIDSLDKGIGERWFDNRLTDRIYLPGSMAGNGKGDAVRADTKWIGDFSRSEYYKDSSYQRWRRTGNIKVPFCLQPVKYYAGPAWYQKTVMIPVGWKGKHISLFLERGHWETTLWVDDRFVGVANALGAPQEFSLDLLSSGKHRLTLRIDNRIKDINPGIDAHSISDHTQTNWNGVVGALQLRCRPAHYISDVQVFPDVERARLHVRAVIHSVVRGAFSERVSFGVSGLPVLRKELSSEGDSAIVEMDYKMGDHPLFWDEFHPNLYTLNVGLGNGDNRRVVFGMRSFKTDGQNFAVNGRRIFLRGTLECAIFPLTGYPPTDLASWARIFRIARSYGLNHLRFHSWCPPEAAFQAADAAGFYLSIECSAWAKVGDGEGIDKYLYAESNRIVKAFGNHPSFCMMPYGNEPSGAHMTEYLRGFVNYWKGKDGRRVYTTASGWPSIGENDYNVTPTPRIQRWGEGVKSIINSRPPATDYDWDSLLPSHRIPTVSHEIGQWCVYPNFRERSKYTGVLRAKNFDIFYDRLVEHGMRSLADSFLLASGKLQVLCYKADIEAALRTPEFAGFQLLDLHDFPGQGTALVGVLDPFWDEKGYVTAKEYRRFCSPTVPLVRMPKLIYLNNERLVAAVEIAHFGAAALEAVTPLWAISDKAGRVLYQGKLDRRTIPIGNTLSLGTIRQDLSGISGPAELTLTVKVDSFSNAWNFFVYPSVLPAAAAGIYVTQRLDNRALEELSAGGRVLLTIKKGSVRMDKGGGVAVGFSSIFWNTAWTNHQAPNTLGILCDPAHPALRQFPTKYYSDYQWWDAMSHCNAIRLDAVDVRIKPIVRIIDDWNTAWPLGLIFECRVGKGRLLVSGVDLLEDKEGRPEARQLLYSLEKYMGGKDFQPGVTVEAARLKALFNE